MQPRNTEKRKNKELSSFKLLLLLLTGRQRQQWDKEQRALPPHSPIPVSPSATLDHLEHAFPLSIQIQERRGIDRLARCFHFSQNAWENQPLRSRSLCRGTKVEEREILHRATANVRVRGASGSRETNSASGFEGRRFVPTGIPPRPPFLLLLLLFLSDSHRSSKYLHIRDNKAPDEQQETPSKNRADCTRGKNKRTEQEIEERNTRVTRENVHQRCA